MKGLIKKIVGALTPTKYEKKSTVFYGPEKPKKMKKGDVWIQIKDGHPQLFRQF